MSIVVRVNKRTESVLLEIDELKKCHEKNIKYALHNIGIILGREIERILTTGARTGRVYRFRGSEHVASAPGEAPATQTGALVNSYNFSVHGHKRMTVGESADHAVFMERGTRFIFPRQHVILGINNINRDTISELSKARSRVR